MGGFWVALQGKYLGKKYFPDPSVHSTGSARSPEPGQPGGFAVSRGPLGACRLGLGLEAY